MRYFRASLPLLLLLAIGCGTRGSAPPTVPVSGRIVLDKAPLAKASVQFLPITEDNGIAIPDANAVTDEQGNYTLKLGGDFGEVQGAVVGKYRVHIGLVERDATSGLRQLVPARYNRNTNLSFTVPPGGTRAANFDLRSK